MQMAAFSHRDLADPWLGLGRAPGGYCDPNDYP